MLDKNFFLTNIQILRGFFYLNKYTWDICFNLIHGIFFYIMKIILIEVCSLVWLLNLFPLPFILLLISFSDIRGLKCLSGKHSSCSNYVSFVVFLIWDDVSQYLISSFFEISVPTIFLLIPVIFSYFFRIFPRYLRSP